MAEMNIIMAYENQKVMATVKTDVDRHVRQYVELSNNGVTVIAQKNRRAKSVANINVVATATSLNFIEEVIAAEKKLYPLIDEWEVQIGCGSNVGCDGIRYHYEAVKDLIKTDNTFGAYLFFTSSLPYVTFREFHGEDSKNPYKVKVNIEGRELGEIRAYKMAHSSEKDFCVVTSNFPGIQRLNTNRFYTRNRWEAMIHYMEWWFICNSTFTDPLAFHFVGDNNWLVNGLIKARLYGKLSDEALNFIVNQD